MPSGHLVYVAGGALWAVAFDLARLETTGTRASSFPRSSILPTGTAEFDVARDGTLVYVAGDAAASQRTLVWVDRRGQEEAIPIPARSVCGCATVAGRHAVAVEIEDQDKISGSGIWLARR